MGFGYKLQAYVTQKNDALYFKQLAYIYCLAVISVRKVISINYKIVLKIFF